MRVCEAHNGRAVKMNSDLKLATVVQLLLAEPEGKGFPQEQREALLPSSLSGQSAVGGNVSTGSFIIITPPIRKETSEVLQITAHSRLPLSVYVKNKMRGDGKMPPSELYFHFKDAATAS